MNLLVDTNLFLDIIFNRPGGEEVKTLFLRMEENGDRAFLTASSATDLFYIIHKTLHDLDETYSAMGKILTLVNILPVDEEDIHAAFDARWRDFEDCVQSMAARHHGMDFIVTRNTKDFKGLAISPKDYIVWHD